MRKVINPAKLDRKNFNEFT